MDQPKELINLFANDNLRGLINVQKFIGSSKFSAMAEYAAAHSVTHGDQEYIVKVLKPLTGTKYFYSAVGWFCSRAALEYKDVRGLPTFCRSSSVPNCGIKIQDVIKSKPPRLNASSKLVAPSSQAAITTKKRRKNPKRLDMLDSWARLPGSFGGGKKR